MGIFRPWESWNASCFIKVTSKHIETHLRNTDVILTFILKIWSLASRVKVKSWGPESNAYLEDVMLPHCF